MRANTDWFKELGWGVFTHYLGSKDMSADEWNERVDRFDIDGLVEQLASTGAGYTFITIGQNSGHYCAPNKTYDSIVGVEPSKCSKRDLVADLADALETKGISLLVYNASGAPGHDKVAMEKLEWDWGFEGEWGGPCGERTGKRLAAFQKNWEAVTREWSLRWGKKVRGWWIDGCYFADEMYRFPDEPNFESYAASMKAGNPDSIVAFNPGVLTPVICHSEFEDYTAGEISDAFPVCPERFIDGAQYHILSYLGDTWCGFKGPRFSDEFVVGYTRDTAAKGGVVTWDVPILPEGLIPQPFIDQLKALGRAGIRG